MYSIPIDLRQDKAKSFICTVALCRDFGGETIRFHEDIESARRSKESIDRIGCGGFCCRDHYIVRIPRGHIRNLKNRGHFRSSSYIRWLVNDNIVWKLD